MVNRKNRLGTALAAILVLAVVVALGTTAVAQHAAKSEGQTVAVDKGKLRQPTPEEMKDLSVDLKQQTTGLRTLTKQGAVGVDLDGSFESAVVVKRNPDGSLSAACVNTKKEAKAFLESKTQSAKPALEEK